MPIIKKGGGDTGDRSTQTEYTISAMQPGDVVVIESTSTIIIKE